MLGAAEGPQGRAPAQERAPAKHRDQRAFNRFMTEVRTMLRQHVAILGGQHVQDAGAAEAIVNKTDRCCYCRKALHVTDGKGATALHVIRV